VEVSKDASKLDNPASDAAGGGNGLCKKDDSGFQPEECWRRIALQRVAGTDEMRFADWGLSWKISKDSCASMRPN